MCRKERLSCNQNETELISSSALDKTIELEQDKVVNQI